MDGFQMVMEPIAVVLTRFQVAHVNQTQNSNTWGYGVYFGRIHHGPLMQYIDCYHIMRIG